MSLVRRSIILVSIVAAAVIASALFFVINDQQVLREMLAQNIAEKEAIFDHLFQVNSDVLRKALRNFDSEEEFARFLPTRSGNNTPRTIESILQGEGVDGFWALDDQGHLIASALLTADGYREDEPLPVQLPDLNGQVLPTQYLFAESPDGLMELCVVSVAASPNNKRSPLAKGYLVVGHFLDASYRQELAAVTNWKIELLAVDQQYPVKQMYQNGELILTRVISGISGQPLRLLRARIMLPAISRIERHNRMHAEAGLAITVTLVGLMMQLVRYQRALRRSKASLDSAQQLAKIGSWERTIADGSGYWSDNCFRLIGLHPRRKPPNLDEFYSLLHEDDRGRVRDRLMASMATGNDFEVEFRLGNDPENQVFLSRGTSTLDQEGKPVRLMGTIQDITEKLQQESAKDQLLKQKEMFIARLSHDLKTPLTPLVALLPQIRRKIADEQLAGLLDICLDNVNYIRALVVKTLKLARFSDPGQAPLAALTRLPLVEMVHEYLRKRADILEQAKMQTEVAINQGITVLADQLELEEVFYNLISNAVKYSPTGSRLVVSATMDQDQVNVCVRDTGSGLGPDDLPHIFDEFFKVDHSRHELDSSGLGLSICKRIIENHGGKIWAESAGKGCGTAICFSIKSGGIS